MALFKCTYPDIPMPSSAAIAYSTGNIDGSSDFQGWVCKAEVDMTITRVGFKMTSRTGASAKTLRVGIVYIDNTTGFPATTPVWADATFSGGAGTAYADIDPLTTSLTTFVEVTLTTAVAIQKGTIFGILLDPTTGTWAASTNLIAVVRGTNNQSPYIRFPYGMEVTSAAFAYVNTACPIFYYGSSTQKYGYPLDSFTGVNIGNGSTPDEIGMYFRIPSTVCSTYKVRGLRVGGALGTGDFDVLLYDTDGSTVLHTVAVDSNILHNGNAAQYDIIFNDDVLATLTASSYYRAVVRPSTATTIGSIQYMSFVTATDKLVFLGNEADVQYTSRVNAGAWTEDTAKLWTMQLLISDMTAPTGTGGVKTHPGMTGGMRG